MGIHSNFKRHQFLNLIEFFQKHPLDIQVYIQVRGMDNSRKVGFQRHKHHSFLKMRVQGFFASIINHEPNIEWCTLTDVPNCPK